MNENIYKCQGIAKGKKTAKSASGIFGSFEV
jgi:hypothetical protein